MTIIKQIKAEIERRLKKYATDVTMPLDELGKVVLELKGVLSFLSTLESEKPMNQKGLEREIERCLWQLTDDPSNDELRMFARHFAELGAEHAREQMMREAVGVQVVGEQRDLRLIDSTQRCLFNAKRGDWLEIIICKKEDGR